MAKVILVNTREHAIHLNVPGTVGKPNEFVPLEPVVIPPCKKDGEGKDVYGELAVEKQHIEIAKKHPVAQHYFKEGWLREKKQPLEESKD